MKCANHPEIDAIATCTKCGRSICRMCMLQHEGKDYCKKCAVKLLSGVREKKVTLVRNRADKFRHFLIAINVLPGIPCIFILQPLYWRLSNFFGSGYLHSEALLGDLIIIVIGILFIVNAYSMFKIKRSLLLYSSLTVIFIISAVFLLSLLTPPGGYFYIGKVEAGEILLFITPILINLVNLWYAYGFKKLDEKIIP